MKTDLEKFLNWEAIPPEYVSALISCESGTIYLRRKIIKKDDIGKGYVQVKRPIEFEVGEFYTFYFEEEQLVGEYCSDGYLRVFNTKFHVYDPFITVCKKLEKSSWEG